MGVEKECSRNGGGYVGGLLQLFDWKAKSRRKLFTNRSGFPERSKQGKRSDGNFPMTRIHLPDEDEIGPGRSAKDGSDYSCASSVTDAEGCGAKPPGVVARLMGLDSLPTSNSCDIFSTPFFDSQSLCDNPNDARNFDYPRESQITRGGYLPYKVDRPVMAPSESKPKKIPTKPLVKFQTETLPPKSAKTILITHHKLLSPIKSRDFISTNSAAHIMEAAAKIIDSGARGTSAKAKMPMVGSSLAPLKVRDLKEKAEAGRKACPVMFSSVPLIVQDTREKVEAAHRPSRISDSSRRLVESNAAKILKGQSMNKSRDGSLDKTSFRVSCDVVEGSSSARNKATSVSLAVQAKVNVQRREGLDQSSSRSLVSQADKSEVKSSQPLKSQSNVRRNFHKKSSTNNVVGGVLRQNNQKQNAQIVKEKLASKPSVSDSRFRKLQADGNSFGQQKTLSKFAGNSKIGSRKLRSEVTPSQAEYPCPYSNTKNIHGKKRSLDGNFNFEKNLVVDHAVLDKDRKTNQSNFLKDSRKRCMDVVSFTFTAPLGRSMHVSETSKDSPGKRVLTDSDGKNVEHNVIGGDALSLILEQKLRELTFVVESSSLDSVKAEIASNASVTQDSTPSESVRSTIPGFHERSYQPKHNTAFSTTGPSVLVSKDKFQEVDDIGGPSSSVNDAEARKLFDCRHPSPVSILEPAFSTESCNTSDTIDGNRIEESNRCSSIQSQEIIDLSYQGRFLASEAADIELSDSATSTSTETVVSKRSSMSTIAYRSIKWELEYVKDITYNVDMMFNNYALGQAHEIVNPQLFDQLESQIGELENDVGKCNLRRRVLFDCVSECLDLRCRQYISGGFRTWMKGVATLTQKERLAREVYKEITTWNSMGDCMVDLLVDRDMSSQYGRWLDFEADAFALGTEIESRVFSSLIDEILVSCA